MKNFNHESKSWPQKSKLKNPDKFARICLTGLPYLLYHKGVGLVLLS